MTDLVGQTLAGRYRVDGFVGRGGMAEVYKVWDTQRLVALALKLLRDDLAEDAVFLRRFRREAATLSDLQHPHIVRFYGLEQDGAQAFMLLDYIDGVSLRKRIFERKGPLPPEEVLSVMQAVTAALHYAHAQGVVHSDMKPANVMLDGQGKVYVADFGIARLAESATTTMAGAGTPAYMAPEQCRAEAVDARTDIYALGITLFEMVTGGERPFVGESAQTGGSTGEKVRWEQLNAAPPSPREFNRSLSPAVEQAIFKCLEKDPARRYASATELWNALASSLSGGASAPSVQPTPSGQATVKPRVIRIGRERENDIQLEGEQVSRRHAEVEQVGGRWRLRDLSANGTFVNGARVQGEVWLQPWDEIQIDVHRLIFGADGQLSAAAASAPARPAPPGAVTMPVEKKRSSVGWVVGILFLLVLLAGGGFFGWQAYTQAQARAAAATQYQVQQLTDVAAQTATYWARATEIQAAAYAGETAEAVQATETASARGTATQQAAEALTASAATARAQAVATANANLTASARLNSTATAQAQASATTLAQQQTATAQAQQTATARARQTATAQALALAATRPTITSVTGPSSIPNNGQSYNFTVNFKDGDGNAQRLVVTSAGGRWNKIDFNIAGYMTGGNAYDGSTYFRYFCNTGSAAFSDTLSIVLYDSAGNASTPYSFPLACTASVSTTPALGTVTFPATVALGQAANGSVAFTDGDGDINRITFEVVQQPASTSYQGFSFNPQTSGSIEGSATGGKILFQLLGNANADVRFQVTLYDAAGNASNAVYFNVRFGSGGN